MLCSPIIHDGYTFTARLQQVAHWTPPTVRYRPALSEDIREFNNQCTLHPGKGQDKIVAAFIARYLAGWDVKDNAGNILPYDAANVSKLALPYQAQLIDLITGYAEGELAADAKNSVGVSG